MGFSSLNIQMRKATKNADLKGQAAQSFVFVLLLKALVESGAILVGSNV